MNVAEGDISCSSRTTSPSGVLISRPHADIDRASHVLQHQIRERYVLKPRSGTAVEFYRASVYLVQHAIGDRDVLRNAAAEAENRPSRAEGAVGDGYKPATAEQRASVILRLHIAIDNANVFAAYEMESVVVAIDAVVDMEAIHPDVGGLDDAYTVVSAPHQLDIANCKVFAAVEKECVRPTVAAKPAGRRDAVAGRVKLQPLAVDRARAFQAYVFRVDCEDQCPVASSSVESPCSGMALTEWYCFPSVLPSNFPAAVTCSVTLLLSSTVPI